MKKIIFQMSVSLDGYFEGVNRQIDWHRVDDEFNAYAADMLKATDALIMGRAIYELMAGYWPTAEDNDPIVKTLMNETPKLVFSRTLKSVEWQNARLAQGDIGEEIARLKRTSGDGLLAVGGNELATSFLKRGLIDELRIIVTPILLGAGRTVFEGLNRRYPLRLLSARPFKSGNVALTYEPMLR